MRIRFLAAALAAASCILALPATAQSKASEIPVETFFKRAEFASMALSPNGKLLAAISPINGRENLVVIDLEKRSKVALTSFSTYDVINFEWVNDKRIFFRVADIRDVLGRITYKGTFAIDIDGGALRNLTDIITKHAATDAPQFKRLAGITPMARIPDSDEMIVEMNYPRFEAADVNRIDTRTGRVLERLSLDAPADTVSFVLDWNRVPRVATSIDQRAGMYTVWYRDGKDSPWTELMSYSLQEGVERIRPLRFNADNKTLFVASNIGRDKAAIYTYDPKAKKFGDLVFEHPLVDIWGGLIFEPNTHLLIGVRYDADKSGVIWIDKEFAKLQASIDASMPKTQNSMTRGDNEGNRFLIRASSDVDPGKYYLLSRTPTMRMEEVVETRPWLKPEQMSPRRFIQYRARDGLMIPAYVTVPRDSSGKNLPLIVNIHGGPNVRSYYDQQWGRPEAQFFASRGYVVLEPEPRASTGFGRKHVLSSFKQWGQAMQDDITDGVLHLVKEGIVDKSKVCLYGASYGGYATLQGLVKEPDLFRCGVAFVAVSDLIDIITTNESDTNMLTKVDWARFEAETIGDPVKDRAMLIANSPAYNAKRIKAPLLLAMGQIDIRVPLEQGRRMRSALEEARVKHEYIVYAGEGHGWNKEENLFDWYKRVEKFFAENLK